LVKSNFIRMSKYSVVIRRVANVMPIIFVVVLRMSTALEYEFDECVVPVEFESAVDMSIIVSKINYALGFRDIRY
jgi:hypothetical protein